jgi:hypothetical protein
MNRRVGHPLHRMGFGFTAMTELSSSKFCERVRDALCGLASYSLAVDDYIAGRSTRKTLEVLVQERNLVQYNFMCLFPDENDTDIGTSEGIVSACQWAGMIYSALCVMPMRAAAFSNLVRKLRRLFVANDFSEEWKVAPKLMTWIIVMVAIAAIGTPERAWAVMMLDRCLRRLAIHSWDGLQKLLSDFLWLPITNEFDGMDLWDEVEQLNPFSSGHVVEEQWETDMSDRLSVVSMD